MMPSPSVLSFLVIGAAALLANPAFAKEEPWTVKTGNVGAGSMTNTVDNVTLAYTRKSGDDDTLRITVADCGDDGWYMEDSLNGVSAESLRDSAKEEFENARLSCKVADGLEQRMMAGFDEAFAQVKPVLPPHTVTVGGWKLADVGSQPGDDSERSITATKELPTVSMVYRPGENGEGASIQLEFKPCNGSSNSSGFDFGNPPEDHFKIINEEVTEAYSDFGKDCKTAPESQATLMQDFPQALATLEGWLKAKPFVYPPEAPSSDKEQ